KNSYGAGDLVWLSWRPGAGVGLTGEPDEGPVLKSRLERAGHRATALCLAWHLLPCAVCHRPENQPVANGTGTAALRAAIRCRCRLGRFDGLCLAAFRRFISITFVRLDLSPVLSQERASCGDLHD